VSHAVVTTACMLCYHYGDLPENAFTAGSARGASEER